MPVYPNNMNNNFHSTFVELFKTVDVNSNEFCTFLSQSIVKCFHMSEGPTDEVEKGIEILDMLFTVFTEIYAESPFSFVSFVNRYLMQQNEIKKFIITVLYNLYFGEYSLANYVALHPKESLEYLLLQTAATLVSKTSLKKIIKGLTFDEQMNLICYCFRHYREGSYPILLELDRKPFAEMIDKLRKRYYDWDYFFVLLKENSAFNTLINQLNDYAERQVTQMRELLSTLIFRMVEAPIQIYQEIEKIKKDTLGESYQHQEMDKMLAVKQMEMLQQRFQPFFSSPFTHQDYLEFALKMGLRGHSPYLFYKGDRLYKDSLIEKLEFLIKIFSNPEYSQIKTTELHDLYAFAVTLQNQIETLRNYPGKILWGLKQMTFAIPTKGKELKYLPSLSCLAKGLNGLKDYLRRKIPNQKIDLRDYPIFVYDQSEEDIFAKNEGFINALNSQYKCAIVHVSLKDALKLANILRIEPLLNTTKSGQMGYAGSRNCVFLLTPVLREAYNQGKKTIQAVLEEKEDNLIRYFDLFTLGGLSGIKPAGDSIYMIDDDMEIPEANILSYAMFMEHCMNIYCETPGYSTGRWTKENLVIPSVEQVLYQPQSVFKFTVWDDNPNTSIYAEMLSKPFLSTNLPFGNEENHFLFTHIWNSLTQTSIHLGGTRYPSKEIPTHSFVGLEELLEKFIPYTIHIAYVSYLLDPLGKEGFGIFPWNNKKLFNYPSSLRDLMLRVKNPASISEMRKMFFTNLGRLIYVPNYKHMLLQRYLRDLIDINFDEAFDKFENEQKLTNKEKKSLKRIRKIYNFYKQDAIYVWEYSRLLLDNIKNNPSAQADSISNSIEDAKKIMEKKYKIKFNEYPLTQGLYLMICAIGTAEFNNTISKLV